MVFVQTCEQTASSEEIHAVMGLAGGAGKGKERGVCLRNRVDERIDVTAGEPDAALIVQRYRQRRRVGWWAGERRGVQNPGPTKLVAGKAT